MPLKKDLGNALWLLLHSTAQIANDHPDPETRLALIEHYRQMEANLIPLLPCPQCQHHYQENSKTTEYQNTIEPKHLNQLNYLHNQVNQLFNKPIFTLEESIQETTRFNVENPQLLHRQYLKLVLTITHYWNNTFWYRPKKRFKHNIKNLKGFLIHSMKLLSLAEPCETQTYWGTAEKPFQKPQIYQFLSQHGLPTNKIPESFSFDFKGCGCMNK